MRLLAMVTEPKSIPRYLHFFSTPTAARQAGGFDA